MIELPKQLQNSEFKFVLLGEWNKWINSKTKEVKTVSIEEYKKYKENNEWRTLGKSPFEKDWANNGYSFDNPKIVNYSNNIGIIGGYGRLRILDIDNIELAKVMLDKINTFAIKTGSGGTHFYFLSNYETNHVLINELGELRAKNYQVVCPPSRHPSGNNYTVIKDLPIQEISSEDLIKLLKPYLREVTPPTNNLIEETDKQKEGKDTSRSGKEYRIILNLLKKGKIKSEIYEEMKLYSKWCSAPEAYRTLTYDKAEDYYLEKQKEQAEQDKKTEEIKKTSLTITEEYLEILKNPNLFNEITEIELDKKIVGERETRKVIFNCANGRLVENHQVASYNLLVNDEAGTGKDYITGSVLGILPKDIYIHKTRISPAVFTYWHNSETEPDWTWNSKVFYPEDISEGVLNSDVFKVMCSNGSSATITQKINGKMEAVELEIKGKPVIITTTATATPTPELVRRFVILNLDSSESQTRAIKKKHSEYAMKGEVPEYNHKYTEAMKYLKRVKVKIPFANLTDLYFPEQNIIMRTHYPRFLDFIKASCAFYQYQRQSDEEGFLLAEGQDYDIARECFLKLCSNKYMISLTINQKKILSLFEAEPFMKGSASQLHSRQMGFMALKNLQDNLQKLVTYGILQIERDVDKYGRDLEVYFLAHSYNKNQMVNIPNFDELLTKKDVYLGAKNALCTNQMQQSTLLL